MTARAGKQHGKGVEEWNMTSGAICIDGTQYLWSYAQLSMSLMTIGPGRINLQDTQNAFGYSIANPSARWKHHVVLSHAAPAPSAQSRDREGRRHENCESRAAGRHFNGAFPSHARQQAAYRPSTQTRKEAQPPTVLNQENAHTLRRMAGDYQKL